jgi:hypothetical protein
VTVDQASGDVEITTGTGRLRVGRVGGTAVLKNSNGDTWVGEATGLSGSTRIPAGTAAWLDLNAGFGTVRNSSFARMFPNDRQRLQTGPLWWRRRRTTFAPR